MRHPQALWSGTRAFLARLGDRGRKRSALLRAVPRLHDMVEWTARVGYGARGFVYLSVGALILMATLGRRGEVVGIIGAMGWLARQPFGRVWLVLVALGLLAIALWRVLQSVFDADRLGLSRDALMQRVGHASSGLGYTALSFGVLRVLLHVGDNPDALNAETNRALAERVLSMPLGNWLLIGAGLAVAGMGIGNIWRGAREDFTAYLACSERLCRRVTPVARAGYIARGLAYLPLAAFVVLAGARSEASEVTSLGSALEALERQPGGTVVLIVTAAGLVAFGVFSFVEARFRRIRAPRDLSPLTKG